MRKTKKALATLAIAGMVMSMAPLQAFADTTTTSVNRLYGADRIQTAINVAQTGWANGASTVILAPAADANLVDALAAAPLAGQENAPILLTEGNALNPQTKAEIAALKATKVYVVGAIDQAVVNELNTMPGVSAEAIKGADRIETAAKIAAKLSAPKGTFVVGYNALADALSVASTAASQDYAVLVANPDGSLPAAEAQYVTGTKYVLGGPTLVSDNAVPGATRIYGQDRYDTNVQVLQNMSNLKYDTVYLANGEDGHLVDSLVASTLAAKTNSPIVLTDNSNVKAASFLAGKMASGSQVVALGGTSVVSDSVRGSVGAGSTTPTPNPTGVVTVSGVAAPGKSVAKDEKLVKIATLNVNATEAGQLTGMKLTRVGLSKDTDIKSIVVYDGTSRLNIPAIVGNSVADFDFTYPLQLAAGQTKSLDVYMNVDDNVSAGEQISFSIDQVRGATNFTPVMTNVFTTADITVGSLSLGKGAGTTAGELDPNGQQTSIWKYKLTAGIEDIKVNRITFTQKGSAASQDIKDFELWNGNTKIAGPVQLQADRTVVFNIPDGLMVKNGESATLDLRATVVGGTDRTVQFVIDNDVDVVGVGQTYGTNIVAASKLNSDSDVSVRTIAPGSLIISRDATSPAAGTIGANTKDVVFGVAKVQANGEAIQLRTVSLKANVTGNGWTKLENVKIISGDTTLVSYSDGFKNSADGTLKLQLSKPLTIQPGTPALLKVTADVKDLAANTVVKLSLTNIDEFARMVSGTQDSVAANVDFNNMTIGDQGITISEVASGGKDIYQSQVGALLDQYDLSHNLSEAVALGSLDIQSSGGDFSNFSNVKLEDADGNVLTDVVTNPSGNNVHLSFKTPITIDVNKTVRVKLVADVKSNVTDNSTFKFSIIATNNQLDATGATTGNDVALKSDSGLGGNVIVTVHAGSGNHLIPPLYSTYFDISGRNNTAAVAKDVKLGGWAIYNPDYVDGSGHPTTDKTQTAYSKEMVSIKSVTISRPGVKASTTYNTLANSKISNIRLVDRAGNVLGSAAAFGQNEDQLKITLTKPLDVDFGTTKYVDLAVVADINASRSDYGKTIEMAIGATDGGVAIEATTKYTGVKADLSFGPIPSDDSTNSAQPDFAYFVVTPTVLNVAAVDVADPKTDTSGNAVANNQVAKFNFTNNGTEAIVLKSLAIKDTLGGINTANINVYNGSNGDLLNSTPVGVDGNGVFVVDVTSNGKTLRVNPGETKTIIVRLGTNVGNVKAGSMSALRLVDSTTSGDTSYTIADGSTSTAFIVDNSATMNVVTFTQP